jgi:hypothetical protein
MLIIQKKYLFIINDPKRINNYILLPIAIKFNSSCLDIIQSDFLIIIDSLAMSNNIIKLAKLKFH